MFQSTLQSRWAVFASVLLGAALSNAAIIYTTESGLNSALSAGFFKNEFEGFDSGQQEEQTSVPQSGGTPTFAYTIATQPNDPDPAPDLYVVGTVSPPITSPSSGQAMSTTVDSHNILVTFTSENVTAVGAHFFLSDVGEDRVEGTLTVTFTFTDDSLDPQTVSSSESGFANFLGVSTDSGTISSMLISGASAGEYVTLDNLYVGQFVAVPEASTSIAVGFLCIFVIGHLVLGRKRSKLHSPVS